MLTPEAQSHYDAAQKATAEGKIYRNDIGLCWPAGMPIMMTRVWPVAMIQLPTAVYMISELMNSLRVVYLDGRQHTSPEIAVPSFNGESIGHWEGDTLVIDTRNFVDEHHWIHDRLGIPASDQLRIVERVRMLEGNNRIQIEFTLTDPKVFKGEWKWTKFWNRVNNRDIAEVECLPDLIPEGYSFDVTELLIGQSVRAKDIVLGADVRLVSNPELVLAHVVTTRGAAETTEGAAAAPGTPEPEVIKKGKKEEEGAEKAEKKK